MALLNNEFAQITARAGVARAGTARAGVVEAAVRLKPGTGQILWNLSFDDTHADADGYPNTGQPPNSKNVTFTDYRS